MKKLSQKRKYGIALYSLFTLSLAASICGTFAWYTYGTRVPVYYNGVSIGDYGSLEIGLVCYKKLSSYDIKRYALTEQVVKDKIIYWSEGSYQADPLRLIQQVNGYANEFTHPVTAGFYDENHTEFKLRNCPTENKSYLGDNKWAPNRDFNRLELAFRYKAGGNETVDENGNVIIGETSYADDFTVMLTSATALSNTNLHEAIRIYLDAESGGCLIDPNKYDKSTLRAGGHLNMGRDAYYDVEKRNLDDFYEYPYGEWDEYTDLVYLEDPYPGLEMGEELLPNPRDPMTFTAEKMPGAYGIDYQKSVFPQIKFEGKDVLNSADMVLCTPKANYNNIAFCDIYIYLEGWDPALDNNEALNDFSFQLQFEAH